MFLEIGEGGGLGIKSGNGFDKARDGEGVAHPSRSADKAERAAFAAEANGDADERGDAGAVDLRNVIEDNDDFARTLLDGGLQRFVQLLGRLTDREAAAHVNNGNSAGIADSDFHGSALRHGRGERGRKAWGHYTGERWPVTSDA